MAQIFDGQSLALKLEAKLKQKRKKLQFVPKLAVLVMRDDPAGQLYCRLKAEAAGRVGISLIKYEFEYKQTKLLIQLIKELNNNKNINGIMIQRPGISWAKQQGMSPDKFEDWWTLVTNKIALNKDVDGETQNSPFIPATVRAVEMIINQVKAEGEILIVGQGMIGKALVKRLKAEGISSRDKNLNHKTGKADILISATGRPKLIQASMIKRGAVVIDVGWPKGDVDFDQVKEKARVITPVPGGVGPITIVCLLENLVNCLYTSSTDDD